MGDGRPNLPFQLSEEVCAIGAPLCAIFERLGLSYCHFDLYLFFNIKQMHLLGIYSRLDQIFDAPNAVKEVLTGQCGLDRSVCFLKLPFLYWWLIWILVGVAKPHEVVKLENVVADYVWHLKLIYLSNVLVLGSVYRVQGNWSKSWWASKVAYFGLLDTWKSLSVV